MAVSTSARFRWVKSDTWEQELERRMCLATAEDTVCGLYFNSTLAVLQSVGDEALVKRCVEASGEERFLDFFHYPVRLQGQMVSAALPTLTEEYGSAEEALRQLGRLGAKHFLRAGVGKAMLSLSPGSPRQLLSSLPTAYRLSVSYGHYELKWTGPRSGRFVLKGDFMPHPFHEGTVSTLLERGGAREVWVSGWPTGGLDSECEFCWQ